MARSTHFNTVISTPVGHLGIELQGEVLSRLVFLSANCRLRGPDCAAARYIVSELRAYFAESRQPDVAVRAAGTDFQRRVWHALRAIPAGRVVTYGALARDLGSGARAVGNACRANPVPIVVPCHRVVACNGPGGFAGDSGGRLLTVKRRLLRLEGVEFGVTRPHKGQLPH